jgi:hypothetical protein
MGVIEDVRKVVQDLVAPELKSLVVRLEGFERESKLRDELILAKLEIIRDSLSAKMDAMSARTEAQYASIMNALDLGRRLDALERVKQAASA